MPRKAIDYSNTTIYKLCCKDPSITDVYVGHTTNFTNRKKTHKSRCNLETTKYYNLYVYQFIRNNGGWNNWSMVEIEHISCTNTNDAVKNERNYIELLGATLNTQVPSNTTINSTDTLSRDEYKKQHFIEYKEHFTKYKHDWYEKNKSITLERSKKRYEENKDTINETLRLKRLEKKNAMSSSIPLLPCQKPNIVEIL